MASHAYNSPVIIVTAEVANPSNTAHIDWFGSRSHPDSPSESAISDVRQAEGLLLSYSPDAPLHFSSSDDNSFAFQARSRRSFYIHSSPDSIVSDFGADESPSSTYNHVTSPFLSPSSHFINLRSTSRGSPEEHLNDGIRQMTLRDIASPPIPQNPDGIGDVSRSRRYSDGLCGGFPTLYHGLRRPQLDQLHSPRIAQIPNVVSNNGLGLTFGNGYTPAREMFSVGQGQTLYPHAPLSPITRFSPDLHTRLSRALSPLGMEISNDPSVGPSFAPADDTGDWAHFPPLSSFGLSTEVMDAIDEPPGGPYSAPESYTQDWVDFPSRPGCGFPTVGVDVDRGGPYSAPASYSEYGAHFPFHSSFGPSTQGMDASDEPSGVPYSAPEISSEDGVHFPFRPGCSFPPPGVDVDRGLSGGSYSAPASYSEDGAHFPFHSSYGLPPQGVDVGHGLFGGSYSAPERYTEEGSHFPSRSSRDLPSQAVGVGHGLSDAPCFAPASFTEDGTHLHWRSICNLPSPGMNASNGPSNGTHSAPASYVEDRAQLPSNFLTSHTSAHRTFLSFFEDERRDPMQDTLAAASSSSAVSCDTTVPSSSPKKTVATAKIRNATEKRRKKPGRFKCFFCESTFTEKHNLNNHHNSHFRVKLHSCERCPGVFGVMSSLTRHRKTCKQTKLPSSGAGLS